MAVCVKDGGKYRPCLAAKRGSTADSLTPGTGCYTHRRFCPGLRPKYPLQIVLVIEPLRQCWMLPRVISAICVSASLVKKAWWAVIITLGKLMRR